MVKLDILFREGKIRKISDTELERYINFFENSYTDNLGCSKAILNEFPRWSIISGYYSMHDITKLLFAKKFRVKVEFEIHATTVKVLRELIRRREIIDLMERGYKEFLSLAQDLDEAKRERVKAQYYTGSGFMQGEFRRRAASFNEEVVLEYLKKIEELLK